MCCWSSYWSTPREYRRAFPRRDESTSWGRCFCAPDLWESVFLFKERDRSTECLWSCPWSITLSLYLLAQKTRGKWTLWATGTGKAKEPYNGWSDGWDSETSRRAGNSKDRSSGIQLLLLEIKYHKNTLLSGAFSIRIYFALAGATNELYDRWESVDATSNCQMQYVTFVD